MRESDKRDERADLAGLVTAASRRVASQRLVSGTLPDVRKATVYPVQENNPDAGMKNILSNFIIRFINDITKKLFNSTTSNSLTIARKFREAYISSRK